MVSSTLNPNMKGDKGYSFNKIYLVLVVIAIFIVVGVFLSFGNPQLKYCYIVQAYLWPNKAEQVQFEKDFTGTWTTWYVNGNVKENISVLDGDLHGSYKLYGENGNLIKLENFEYGDLHGRQVYYTPTGNVMKIAIYEKGQVDEERHFSNEGVLTKFIIYGFDSGLDGVIVYDTQNNVDKRKEYEKKYQDMKLELPKNFWSVSLDE